jgi:hypothetical protein
MSAKDDFRRSQRKKGEALLKQRIKGKSVADLASDNKLSKDEVRSLMKKVDLRLFRDY